MKAETREKYASFLRVRGYPEWSIAEEIAKAEKAANAHSLINKAIRDGVITRMPCSQCGNQRSHAHHPDYDQPYAVIWLCNTHHRKEHSRLFHLSESDRIKDSKRVTAQARIDIGHNIARNQVATFFA